MIATKYIKPMVFILDGNSEHVAHAGRKMGIFGDKKIRFVTPPRSQQMP